jgi:hypothetical protein
MVGLIPAKFHGTINLIRVGLSALLLGMPLASLAQSQISPPAVTGSSVSELQGQRESGSIAGAVVDPSGAAIAGAWVKLSGDDPTANQEVQSDNDGLFTFGGVSPGNFHFTIAAEGFATYEFSGLLHPGETFHPQPIVLSLAPKSIEVKVTVPQFEVAEEQVKQAEKQRVLGFIPNFYVSYVPNAAPLNSKQKFKLAWRSTLDPVTIALTGVLAGVEQANNFYSEFGQGLQGFGKRYGAAYADLVTSTFIGDAILPSLLKQDPRYFYKGTGSTRSRILYAILNSVICKGDNGHWQANYSGMFGAVASGGISTLYYPTGNRNRAELTFTNAAIRIGTSAAANLLQEFLFRKLTRTASNHQATTP